MFFQSAQYSPAIAALLDRNGSGRRALPLVRTPEISLPAEKTLAAAPAAELFPGALSPSAALAGLHLYLGDWAGAHELAQNIESPEGRYWHAIVHRMEPDASNAGYWFRALGPHPVFGPLLREARVIASMNDLPLAAGKAWDPFAFVKICGEAAARPGSALERAAREVQLAEWQLLFDYCASAGRRSVEA
jgi:hypothetical protein